MQTSILGSILLVALAGGCAGSGQLTYETTATAPELVVISPGVQVIADYNEPIFYSDNYYWRNDGGAWYRSRHHTRGWARVEVAPVAIRTIERPSAYVHYRARANVGTPAAQRDDRNRNDRNDRHDDKDKRDHNDHDRDRNDRKHD